jgi:hypothetical protein
MNPDPEHYLQTSKKNRIHNEDIYNFCKSGSELSKLVRSMYIVQQCYGSGIFIPDTNFPIPDPEPMVKKIPDLDRHQRI